MIEVEAQKLICDVVKANGGMAVKLSHRFVSGVSDLLVKLPVSPPFLLEAKLQKTKTFRFVNDAIFPAVTMLQNKFLESFAEAGMVCGIASFIQGPKGKADLHLLLKIVRMGGMDYRFGDHLRASEHTALGDHKVRDQNLFRMLRGFAHRGLG